MPQVTGAAGARGPSGLAWMGAASLLFTSMNLAARLASRDVHWAMVASVRCLCGALLAVAIARVAKKPLRVRDSKRAWLRSIAGTCALVCTFYALSAGAVALGDVATLMSATPIYVAIFAPLVLRETSSRATWLAAIAGLGGVALVSGVQLRASGAVAVVASLGAVASAVAMLSLRAMSKHESAEAVVVHFSIVSFVATLAIAAPNASVPSGASVLWLLATGLAGGLAQLAMTRAYALERAARVSTMGYLTVVFSHAAGALFLRDRVTPAQVAGAGLVIAAGLLLARDKGA